MDGVHINTSQNVTIDYNLADVGVRVLARILDFVFIFVYFIFFYLIFVGILANNAASDDFLGRNDGAWGVALFFLIGSPVFLYSLWAPYFMQGQTFGKKIMQIKIVRADGREASFGTYFVRWLSNVLDTSFFYGILGLIVMASNQKRQRIADLIAKTVVISTKQQIHVDQTVLSHIDETYQPKFGQVLQLSDRDIQIIKSSLERAKMNMDFNLVKKLRDKVEHVIQEHKPEMTDVEYVETVLKDYQYFSQQ